MGATSVPRDVPASAFYMGEAEDASCLVAQGARGIKAIALLTEEVGGVAFRSVRRVQWVASSSARRTVGEEGASTLDAQRVLRVGPVTA